MAATANNGARFFLADRDGFGVDAAGLMLFSRSISLFGKGFGQERHG